MKQTAVEFYREHLMALVTTGKTIFQTEVQIFEQAKEMDKQQKMDAYKHGRDDENCALSDGAMCPDYDNADEWYQGEYGGEQ